MFEVVLIFYNISTRYILQWNFKTFKCQIDILFCWKFFSLLKKEIFYFNCEHFLFVYIHCKTIRKQKFANFIKIQIVDFQNLLEIEFYWRLIFKILIIHKPSLGLCVSFHKKMCWIGLAVLTFIGHKQTNRQTIKV